MDYLDIALKAKARREVQDNHQGLIDHTLREINKAYKPGTLEWVKVNRPQEWNEMIVLEKKINEKALKEDVEALKEALSEYKELILSRVKTFKTLKAETGNSFDQGGLFRVL